MTNKPEQYEKDIREQRIVDATKNGYLGQNSKLIIILKNLGQPIVAQSEGGTIVFNDRTAGTAGVAVTRNYLDDPYDDPEDDMYHAKTPEDFRDRVPTEAVRNPDGSIPVPSGDDWRERNDDTFYTVSEVGWHFDGLDRGMHMEIQYTNETNVLQVTHKGYEVYREVRGDLQKYVPIPEWEGWVDHLFKSARKLERAKRKALAKEDAKEIEKEKLSWLQRLRTNWGI